MAHNARQLAPVSRAPSSLPARRLPIGGGSSCIPMTIQGWGCASFPLERLPLPPVPFPLLAMRKPRQRIPGWRPPAPVSRTLLADTGRPSLCLVCPCRTSSSPGMALHRGSSDFVLNWCARMRNATVALIPVYWTITSTGDAISIDGHSRTQVNGV